MLGLIVDIFCIIIDLLSIVRSLIFQVANWIAMRFENGHIKLLETIKKCAEKC